MSGRASLIATLATCMAAAAFAAALKVEGTGGVVQFKDGDATRAEYVYEKVPFKPYVRQLCSPTGVNVLRDNVADHLHHHALMFAVGVDGVNFWEETPASGKQAVREVGECYSASVNGVGRSGYSQGLDWKAPGIDKPLITENRRIELLSIKDVDATVLNWSSELSAGTGKDSVKLGGGHYYGLGMRFLKSFDEATSFFTPAGPVNGEIVRGDERLTKGAWCAGTGKADGKPVTVTMFDHPGNPRPALWFTMTKPFAYLSATMNYWREPLVVETGKPITLRYGVAVWDGTVKPEQIEKAYQQWLAATKTPAAGK